MSRMQGSNANVNFPQQPDREGRKITMGESSNLGMQSQLVVELDLGWVMEEKEKELR